MYFHTIFSDEVYIKHVSYVYFRKQKIKVSEKKFEEYVQINFKNYTIVWIRLSKVHKLSIETVAQLQQFS